MKPHRNLLIILSLLLLPYGCETYKDNFNVPQPSIAADFSYESITNFDVPDTIFFVNETYIPPEYTSGLSYMWDFGDSTTSTEENPVHVYQEEGTFTVTLTPVPSAPNRVIKASDKITLIKQLKGDTLFYEDFDDIKLFPPDWVLVNVDGNTPDNPDLAPLKDSAWVIRSSTFFEGNIAFGNSWYNPEADCDDWFILPKVTLGENSSLQWKAMSFTTSGNYPDSYQVRISTTTQDISGCMTNPPLARIIDESWREDADNPGEGIKTRKVPLTGYENMDAYIAFRLNTLDPGGDRIGIDEILIIDE